MFEMLILLAGGVHAGRQTPRSPLAAISGAWEEGALAHSPKAGSPAALEGRDRKYSRSDSEG